MFSLQWALTHRSFPRILPASSNYSGAIPNSFQVWRRNEFHQAHAFSKIAFKSFSLLTLPLRFSFSRSISVILVVFLVVIWRPTKSFSSKSCLFSLRFVVLASYYPLKLFHLSDILFLTIRSILEVVFPVSFHRRPSFQLSFSIYPGASFKCSLISSWSLCSFAFKYPLAYLFF